MNKTPRPLTDAELVAACVNRSTNGSAFVDSQLAQERKEVMQYYRAERPYPLTDGGSKFVSQDVFEAVEAIKAQLTEAYAAGPSIVRMAPQSPEDVPQADQATRYCEYVLFRQNDGLSIINGAVHDSAINRLGIAKVYWDKSEVATSYTFDNASADEARQLLQSPDVRLTDRPRVDQEAGPDGQPMTLVSGAFDRVEDTSQVRIELIPPEEFIVSGRFTSLDKAPYVGHRSSVALGDLVDDGYDPAVVYSISGDNDELAFDQERQERQAATMVYGVDDMAEDEAGRIVTVHESYIRIDMEGSGRQQLWRVVHVGDTLLDKQKVAEHPFVTYSLMPEPHSFYGGNFAERTIQHANTKTTLTRAIIEQAVDATNPRWQVARGGVTNPRELISDRRGGIVNVRDVTTSVAPLPKTPINPYVMQTIGMVDQAREDTTGISRLSQGLDKGALSHQNSAGLVEQLTSNSQVRSKVMARHFASQFLAPLYLKIYAVGIENDRERMLEVGGKFEPISPQRWRRRTDVRVSMELVGDEAGQVAEELLTFDKYMKETGGRLYDEARQYNVIKRVLEIKGHPNVGDYLANPAELPPPEPDPKAAAELEDLKVKTDTAKREQDLREANAQHKWQVEIAELQLKSKSREDDVAQRTREGDRKDAETANRIDVAMAELELAITQSEMAPPENIKASAIISPNS